MQRKEFAAVDIFKFICAILVMLIHTKPFENIFWLDAGIGLITRFAVPYFFAISGFFLFYRIKECENRGKVILHWFLRLLRFYTIWFIISRSVDILIGESIGTVAFYTEQFFFATDVSPLWFINALLWGMLIAVCMSMVIGKKLMFSISVVFLSVGYVSSTLQSTDVGVFTAQFLSPVIDIIGIQNGLFFAFPYIAMGALISDLEIKKNYTKDIILVLVFFISLAIEAFLVVLKLDPQSTFLWLSALPMTFFVVRLTLSIELDNRPIFFVFRKISTLFYVLHVLIIQFVRFWFDSVGFSEVDTMNLVLTLMTLIASLLLAAGIYYLSKAKHFGWLKYVM